MNLFNLIFFILYSAPKKSCLKKGDSYTKKGLNVHFKDLSLVEVKIFKSTDEPNAPNITQEEYMKIQEEVRNNPEKHKTKIEEIRKKEVNMDNPKQKEIEISWKFPKKLYLDEEVEKSINEQGKDSIQNKFIEELCSTELKTYYFKKEIPEPTELEKKLYSFTDDDIQKIENSKIATKTNDITIADVSKFWDNLGNNITKQNLIDLEELLEKAIDIESDTKNQILEQARNKYEQEMNNQNFQNPNNININNNLTINNNQKFLMSGYSNLNINPDSALQIINNMKALQPNLDQGGYPNVINDNYLNQNIQEVFKQQNINSNPQNILTNQIPNMNIPNFTPQNYNQINNFQQANKSGHHQMNIDQKMMMESCQRMNVSKYKTKPCRNYHSPTGCTRGDNCFFIHDEEYKGREIQNFDVKRYERNFPIQLGFLSQGMAVPQIQNINPQLLNQLNMGQIGLNQMNLAANYQQLMGLTGNMNNFNQN